jgi:hypothetical protein
MQQKAKDGTPKKTMTAHASSAGVAVITHDYLDGAQAVELVAMHNEAVEGLLIWPQDFFRALSEGRLDEVDEPVELTHYEEARQLNKYRAFGESSNFNELAAERIGYGVNSDDIPFVDEIINFADADPKDIRRACFPGELRGFQELDSGGAGEDLLEPLTIEEALIFISKMCPDTDVSMDELTNTPSIEMWLKPELERVTNMLIDAFERSRLPKEEMLTILYVLGLTEETWKRIKLSVKRNDVGQPWSCANIHSIGNREGTVEDQSRQNDKMYSKLEQYHNLGERVDGRLLFCEEIELSSQKNDAIYNSMYYQGGEVTNMDDVLKHDAEPILAKPGDNKGWSERSVYYMRCAMSRDEVFADKLWHILTWPLDLVEPCMEKLREEYKASVRANSAGPNSEKINGRWRPAPLRGKAAIDHILRTGKGTLAGKVVSKDVNLLVGSTWHKLFLSRKHMDALESALMWRQGIIRLDVAGQKIEERFNQTVQSLPRDYVLSTYGRKA